MTKILLVEDHQSLAKDIKDYLELEQGREVSTALDGEKGLMMAKLYDYDLILLDLMLPRLDGKSFCQSLRKEKTTPIIVITAKSQLEDKIDLFSLGADDYLVKPFHLEELLVRGKALLRRGSIAQQFQWKDFIIDFPSKKVKKVHWGKISTIHLTLKEFQILEFLIRNNWRSISRTEMMGELWGDDAIWEQDGKLDVHIANIRRKLNKKIIETIKGFGYLLGQDDA